MTVKGDCHTPFSGFFGVLGRGFDDFLVTLVYAVEHSNDNNTGSL
jgi:hypothetical protein